jgi:hypothetical protein
MSELNGLKRKYSYPSAAEDAMIDDEDIEGLESSILIEEREEEEDNINLTNDLDELEAAQKRLKTEKELLQSLQLHSNLNTNTMNIVESIWRRPELAAIDPSATVISLQNTEADYTLSNPIDLPRYHNPHAVSGQKIAVIRLFGCTAQGNSVLVNIHNFLPYFYIPTW